MFCPMKFNSNTLDGMGDCLLDTCRCDEEQCAWWEGNTGECMVTNLYLLADIEHQLNRLANAKEANND